MHVAVLQSAYIPWRGYFDIIRSVDLFVVYDDVQYSKGSWRNRNKVKSQAGPKWLTVPVNLTMGEAIEDVTIAYSAKDWVAQHQGLLHQALGRAPFFAEALQPWERIAGERPERLSDLNVALMRAYCNVLEIGTPFTTSSDHVLEGSSTDRLLQLLGKVGATSYLSGPAAQAYLNVDAFRKAGIDLYYKTYDFDPYPQLWEGFQPDVTILDAIANLGPDARHHIRSRSGDRKVEL